MRNHKLMLMFFLFFFVMRQLCDWVMKHKRKRIKVDKFVPKKKNSRIDE